MPEVALPLCKLPLRINVRLRPPDRLTVAEWADRHRVLDPIYTPGEPGPYNHKRTPYLCGIWDAFQDHRIRQITAMCSTQVGKTEALMNMLGFVIAEDPSPIVLVNPTEARSREFKDRIAAMVQESPTLRQFSPQEKRDDLRTQVRYGAALLYLRGGESPSQLSSVAARYAFVEEADKTPSSTSGGREAGTIALIRHRLRTVSNSKLYVNSTPSTRVGPIWQEWERSDQRLYEVPCPHCEHFQRLEFARIRWPKDVSTEQIETQELATYHCVGCDQPIDPLRERDNALARGRWVATRPTGRHAGFHISALYSPWLTWSQIAVEHLRAVTKEQRQDFINGYLGWIFEEQLDRMDPEALKLRGGYLSGEVPAGVRLLVAGVDCGVRTLHYEVRGFGDDCSTWLIEAGKIQADSLKACLLEFEAQVLSRSFTRDGVTMSIRQAFIDSGYKPMTVGRFCRRRKATCRAVAGRDHLTGLIIKSGLTEKTIAGQVTGLPVVLIDVNAVKDQISETMGHTEKWHAPSDTPEDWPRHMAAEQAVMLKKAGRYVKRWQPLPGAGANHWLDACTYAFAAAYALGGWTLHDGLARRKRPAQPQTQTQAPAQTPAARLLEQTRRPVPPMVDRQRGGSGGRRLLSRGGMRMR